MEVIAKLKQWYHFWTTQYILQMTKYKFNNLQNK